MEACLASRRRGKARWLGAFRALGLACKARTPARVRECRVGVRNEHTSTEAFNRHKTSVRPFFRMLRSPSFTRNFPSKSSVRKTFIRCCLLKMKQARLLFGRPTGHWQQPAVGFFGGSICKRQRCFGSVATREASWGSEESHSWFPP